MKELKESKEAKLKKNRFIKLRYNGNKADAGKQLKKLQKAAEVLGVKLLPNRMSLFEFCQKESS